jgi:hypothetical protein
MQERDDTAVASPAMTSNDGLQLLLMPETGMGICLQTMIATWSQKNPSLFQRGCTRLLLGTSLGDDHARTLADRKPRERVKTEAAEIELIK